MTMPFQPAPAAEDSPGEDSDYDARIGKLPISSGASSAGLTAGEETFTGLTDPKLYLNRELTWLAFNSRVLHEAADPRTPLLERLKFIAIVSGNLDEFFMKRIGGLKLQVAAGVQALTVDGRSPSEQIAACCMAVRELEHAKQTICHDILVELRAKGVEICRYDELSPAERAGLRAYYLENVFPLVTPQIVDPAHPFPFISNLSLNLLVSLQYRGIDEPLMGRIKVPVGDGVARLIRIGTADPSGRHRFVPLEEVMSANLDLLFPGTEVASCAQFYVTRNANTEREEEPADDLLALIESEVRERYFAPIVRLLVHRTMPPEHRGRLAAELGLDVETDVFEHEGLLACRDLFEIASLDLPELRYPPHRPIDPPLFNDVPNVFHALRAVGSTLFQLPYESFSGSVERFLRAASEDPKVSAIKMTLYRTSEKTKVIEYLIDAAKNGKQVAVVVELKARFDEVANIRWAARLEEAGIHVTYGVVGLKTHCKLILVVRRDFDGLRLYAHIGTGNFHAETARLYDDIGLLTCDPTIGRDAIELFNYLTTGYTPGRTFQKLLPAPKFLKDALIAKIRRETAHHEAGRGGLIQFKINALEDVDMTRELYQASQAGVRIDLIVRDTCRLRPGLPGFSETVTVLSVVGRFLEHSRVYYFRNGGRTDEDGEYYIGSADAMKRNLEQRVEVLAPVERAELRAQLRRMLDLHLNDQRSAWEMGSDGTYFQRQPSPGLVEESEDGRSLSAAALGCQQQLIQIFERLHGDSPQQRLNSERVRRAPRSPRNLKRIDR